MKSFAKRFVDKVIETKIFGKLFWFGSLYLEYYVPSYLSSKWQQEHVSGNFRKSTGENVTLVDGLRDNIKPGWRSMLCAPTDLKLPSVQNLIQNLAHWRNRIDQVTSFLSTHDFSISGKNVLEIGTFDGATAYALAEAGAASVIGTDLAQYYINQTPDSIVSADTIALKNRELEVLRLSYHQVVENDIARRVSFQDDDICSSTVLPDSMDFIFSWEVLEHLTRPLLAFEHMFKILKPGGVVFHEYNPFFSIAGGHSLCTLDFLWGHARLSDSDFERYLEEVRPNEMLLDLAFYRNNLNRMTFADLNDCALSAGFKIISVIPWSKRIHLELVTKEILDECKENYPNLEITDLISPTVWLLLQKNI